jgi:hypothetical protein
VYSTSILTVQWDMLAISVHQISLQYLCLARPGEPGRAGPPRSLNRHRRGRGCCIQRLRLNKFTKTKRWRNCKNGLAKVKIIMNWSVWKRKTFENNYSQGKLRMGMPLRYIETHNWISISICFISIWNIYNNKFCFKVFLKRFMKRFYIKKLTVKGSQNDRFFKLHLQQLLYKI